MARHLTPTELAREIGIERREVILKWIDLGIPIFNGKIDKDLFLAALSRDAELAAIETNADHFTLLDSDGNMIDSFTDLASARTALQTILASEPAARGSIALLAYDATGHPLGELSGVHGSRRSTAPASS